VHTNALIQKELKLKFTTTIYYDKNGNGKDTSLIAFEFCKPSAKQTCLPIEESKEWLSANYLEISWAHTVDLIDFSATDDYFR